MNTPQVICLGTKEFEELISRMSEYIKTIHNVHENDYISTDEAMRILGISSYTTIAKLRSQGHIAFTQPIHKIILYSRKSIYEYLNKHKRNTF
jgi:Mn-dependent DtxR family transcriptional regulator